MRGIGPIPCQCLQQLLAAPFLIERTRLQYMRGFQVRCIELAPATTLAMALADPRRLAGAWRRFSFAAAHDALQLGVEPSLQSAPLDPEHPPWGVPGETGPNAMLPKDPTRAVAFYRQAVEQGHAKVANATARHASTVAARARLAPTRLA